MDERTSAFRNLPAVHKLVDELVERGRVTDVPHPLVVAAARKVLDDQRAVLASGAEGADADGLADLVVAQIAADRRPRLEPVINATGIIIHTGLGRSPWPREAVEAASAVASGYAPVELDLPSGRRGKRSEVVRELLCELTGAESATVVNNNAAALMLVLAAVATGRGVVVSRGELIEIGGSFRLPDVMKAGGAKLQEVGTTNRTRLGDYERAIDDTTAALMKVHTSNYRVEGFTEAVTIDELVTLGHAHGVPVIDDIGSGALRPASEGPLAGEPSARESIAAGADLVLFSGDKLLGGPQAGIIVGTRTLVDRVERHPMMRAMRVDKVMLAALATVLQLHRDDEQAAQTVPVLDMLRTPVEVLRERAKRIVEQLQDLDRVVEARVERTMAYVGGGSLPTEAIPSVAVSLRPDQVSELTEETLADRLRRANVVPRVGDGAVWLDLRTVFADQDADLLAAVRSAVG
jgi:L-seryl-tRNA(Ser) seleniumtransferase